MEDVPNEMRQRAFAICKDFLGGSWKHLNLENFRIDQITGGLSNMMYKCSKTDRTEDDSEDIPQVVVLRIYGQIIQENPETVVTDSVICALLAEKKLGPKLHGVFTGGRVEEYVESRHLHTWELRKPEISINCAQIMAGFHQLDMPLMKKPRWLHQILSRYLDDALNNVTFHSDCDIKNKLLEKILSYNLASELITLTKFIENCHSPVVFCHNDLQEGNILFSTDGSQKGWHLLAIDFEYCSYNYRGFDIANHFCEWCYSYEVDHPPYFTANSKDFPTREQQLRFIREYLQVISPQMNESRCLHKEENAILLEVQVFTLASDFMWALWSLVQYEISTIRFNYLDYAMVRFEAYFSNKTQLLHDHPKFKDF